MVEFGVRGAAVGYLEGILPTSVLHPNSRLVFQLNS